VVELIEQLVDLTVLSHSLISLASTLSLEQDLHFYTDGSLQRDDS